MWHRLISSVALTRFRKRVFYTVVTMCGPSLCNIRLREQFKMCLNIINQHGRTRLVHIDHVTLIPIVTEPSLPASNIRTIIRGYYNYCQESIWTLMGNEITILIRPSPISQTVYDRSLVQGWSELDILTESS